MKALLLKIKQRRKSVTSSNPQTTLKQRFGHFTNTDIPLEHDIQTKFLITLIALMTFLLVLAASGSLILNDMTKRWSSGLQNKITLEVASETDQGFVLSQNTIDKEIRKLQSMLDNHPLVKKSSTLKKREIRELISPWIGTDLALDGIPLPGLIAIELKQSTPEALLQLKRVIKTTSKYAYLETHSDWLNDFLGLINTLKTLSLTIALLVLAITIISVTTAMHTRLALHKKNVQLLHLMGASDTYIAKQFMPHAIIIAFKGSLIGTVCAILLTIVITKLINAPMIPTLKLDMIWYFILASSPIFITIFALITSRITLLRTLLKMP